MTAKIEELDKELYARSATLAKGRLGGAETRAIWREIDELLEARYLLTGPGRPRNQNPERLANHQGNYQAG